MKRFVKIQTQIFLALWALLSVTSSQAAVILDSFTINYDNGHYMQALFDDTAYGDGPADVSAGITFMEYVDSLDPARPFDCCTDVSLLVNFTGGIPSTIDAAFGIGDLLNWGGCLATASSTNCGPVGGEDEPGGDSFSSVVSLVWTFHHADDTGSDPDPVPEPESMALLLLGLIGLKWARRRIPAR